MNKYAETVKQISLRLDSLSDFSNCSYNELLEAQKYSLTAGGKHLRGLILIKCAELGGVSVNNSVDYACALEMIQTYSLIHDDLPEMDNDDLRRGKPTCHKIYGADIALLAGDALLTKAFNVIASDKHFDVSKKIECIRILSEKCGEHGMLAGQAIDKKSENTFISKILLKELHHRKTGELFCAAVQMGCVLGNLDADLTQCLTEYIEHLGIAFQIKDDILDVESSPEVLGKPTDSDERSVKSTYVSIYGLDKSKEILSDEIAVAKSLVKNIEDSFFVDLADYFFKREK